MADYSQRLSVSLAFCLLQANFISLLVLATLPQSGGRFSSNYR